MIFFAETSVFKYGHVAIVDTATADALTVVEQNMGSGNGDGLGNNAITRRTVYYRGNPNRPNVVGWYTYIGDSQVLRDEAVTRGIWNGERENDLCTRSECAVMAKRAGGVSDDSSIWTGVRANDPVIRQDAALMIARGIKKSVPVPSNPTGTATRGEVAEMAMKSLT